MLRYLRNVIAGMNDDAVIQALLPRIFVRGAGAAIDPSRRLISRIQKGVARANSARRKWAERSSSTPSRSVAPKLVK
jgi:hypothetical protein